MKKISRWFVFLPLLAILSACSDNNGSDDTPTRDNLEASGKIPKLDRSDDLAGPDADENGIRDDIDRYIASQFEDAHEIDAASQAARANQKVLTLDLDASADESDVRQVNQDISRATACVYSVFDDAGSSIEPAAVSRDLESITFNTADRLKAYMTFNKALDGTSWSLPEGDSCE